MYQADCGTGAISDLTRVARSVIQRCGTTIPMKSNGILRFDAKVRKVCIFNATGPLLMNECCKNIRCVIRLSLASVSNKYLVKAGVWEWTPLGMSNFKWALDIKRRLSSCFMLKLLCKMQRLCRQRYVSCATPRVRTEKMQPSTSLQQRAIIVSGLVFQERPFKVPPPLEFLGIHSLRGEVLYVRFLV